MRKNWIIGGVAAVVMALFVGAYALSPLLAAQALTKAARDGDTQKLEALVDFPAVREGLKTQLNTALITKFQNAPELKDNPFAGLALMVVPALVDRAVDAMITPQGIAALSEAKKPDAKNSGAQTPESAPAPDALAVPTPTPAPDKPAETRKASHGYSYIGLNRFKASTWSNEDPAAHIDFIFERRNLFSWKLVSIELPTALLNETADEPAAPASESLLKMEKF